MTEVEPGMMVPWLGMMGGVMGVMEEEAGMTEDVLFPSSPT
jgi:hypothetical protein